MSKVLINHVKRATCAVYGVSSADLEARDRHQRFAEPRQMAMAVAKHLTEQSYPQIGRSFQRSHSNVVYAVQVVNERAVSSPKDYETFFEIARLARAYAAGNDTAARFSRSADLGVIPNAEIRAMHVTDKLPPAAISQRLGVPVTEVARVLDTVA